MMRPLILWSGAAVVGVTAVWAFLHGPTVSTPARPCTGGPAVLHGVPVTTLCLRPGVPGTVETPASNIPPGVVRVSVPLYPGAAPSSAHYPSAFLETPGSPYLKAARAEYLLPVSETTAEGWYGQRFAAFGYHVFASGSSGNFRTGVQSQGSVYASNANPNLQVDVSFQAAGGRRTLLLYWVTDIVAPPRPKALKLPTDMVRVAITYRPWQPNPPTIHRTVTSASELHGLVQDINALPVDTRGVVHCAADFGQGATLRFTTDQGGRVTVSVNPACASVVVGSGPGLFDANGRVWNAVQAAMGSLSAPATASVSRSGPTVG